MIVVIEGVDGTGKSCISKLLAKALGAVLYSTPPERYLAERDDIDARAGASEHYRFYLQAVRDASVEIGKLKEAGRSVVVDRYWLTTAVYHRAMGVSVGLSDFEGILLPDATVYLSAASDVQRTRLIGRTPTAGDIRMWDLQEELRRNYEELLVVVERVIRVDTTYISKEEVVKRICAGLD
ncbi:MAG: hypothetical protein KGI73_04650 [Patescibacteria group bacterium]|nr:hypothetical protein [Patescibacteria group bacterium]